MTSKFWTREQVLVALNLYTQLPFGKMHRGNPLIIKTAQLIGRTADALAMKLNNLASLDPQITNTGRKGLQGCSALDKAIWMEFQQTPETIGYESQLLVDQLAHRDENLIDLASTNTKNELLPTYFSENKTANVKVRVQQSFFRKAVLSSYENRCCMTGLAEPRLLVASHIVPWSQETHTRLNPRNGLCLSALHDRAYDRGLLSVSPDFIIRVSPQLQKIEINPFTNDYLLKLDGMSIWLPKKFSPMREFLDYHYSNIFLG
jgi:predicted restriction endonuclease